MLFPRRNRGESVRVEVIQTTRDIIEIVAILLAGAWAIYIFVYENKIKPASFPPEVTFSAQMQAGTPHRGLLPVRIATTLRNTGTVQAHVLGFAIVVMGSQVQPADDASNRSKSKGSNVLTRFYSNGKGVPVYRAAWLSHLTDPSIGTDLLLRPGQVEQSDYLAYVPQRRFDRLALYVVTDFTKDDDATIPTKMVIAPNGLPEFRHANPPGIEIDQISTAVTFLDIAGR